jgi:hypothetical protein
MVDRHAEGHSPQIVASVANVASVAVRYQRSLLYVIVVRVTSKDELVATGVAAKQIGVHRGTLVRWWQQGLVEPELVTPGVKHAGTSQSSNSNSASAGAATSSSTRSRRTSKTLAKAFRAGSRAVEAYSFCRRRTNLTATNMRYRYCPRLIKKTHRNPYLQRAIPRASLSGGPSGSILPLRSLFNPANVKVAVIPRLHKQIRRFGYQLIHQFFVHVEYRVNVLHSLNTI